ncbi:HK97-gp10 family putative phage morphogenesis protein [Georhizobium sp. MAB10]|uniref:HK97-gp10 family putative phage morphogenesis protein n=1 Tax=Georhizobium sp. MAB10 TaxID=3028319 RepID=UPI003855C839
MAERVRVDGLRELEQAMMELSRATSRNVARKALMKGAEPILESAQAAAPVGPTGNLKASYGIGTKLTRRQQKLHKKESPVEVFVGPNDPAAVQTEFGNAHQAAQPHLRPAWDSRQKQTLEIIKTELGTEIDKAAKRAARKTARLARRASGG